MGADFGFITDEELQSLTEHSKGEQGELKRASDKKVTDLEEEARKYKYRAEEEVSWRWIFNERNFSLSRS